MAAKAPAFSIILAAGKGTRMQSSDTHKVCIPVDGEPVINRSLRTYTQAGIRTQVVVVGDRNGQVVETAGRSGSNVLFAYQAEQLGTAHAARQGLRALDMAPDTEAVLLIAGDRIIELAILEKLFHLFYSQHCDLAFLATPRRSGSGQGRLVLHQDGTLLGNVEMRDVQQRRVFRTIQALVGTGRGIATEELEKVMRDGFTSGREAPSEKRLATAFGALWQAVSGKKGVLSSGQLAKLVKPELTRFTFIGPDGKKTEVMPEQVEKTPLLNSSVYLVNLGAFRYALSQLDRNNAQQEEYLSDLITILAQSRAGNKPRFKVAPLEVKNPHYVMGYNDPSELLEVESYVKSLKQVRAKGEVLTGPAIRTVADWQKEFKAIGRGTGKRSSLYKELTSLYGDDRRFIQDRVKAFQQVLKLAGKTVGRKGTVVLVRSPGRLNLLGRHVDHQGGTCNLMTIGYETLMAVHPRSDDRVRLVHADRERFPARSFSIGQLVSDLPWDDWFSLVKSETVSRIVHATTGEWSNFIKAAVLRLQKKFNTIKLRGMDIAVTGNVPVAAGLSSSSTLVVGTAEAMAALNRLETFPAQMVDLCGEGEQFVSLRGGAAEHAATKFGRKGQIIKVSFFDFAVQDTVLFPESHLVLVCDSGIRAQKTRRSKDQFNHRVACYQIGFLLIRKLFPQYAPLLAHLRDVNVRNLKVPLSWIYKILLHLPEQATRKELKAMLPDTDLEPIFATHQLHAEGYYPVRGVVLYGLAECERSRKFAGELKNRRFREIGRLMNASHDGDRVVRVSPDGRVEPYKSDTSNSSLLNLIEDLESGDIRRVESAQLEWQPGDYHCSIPEIDRMVDTVLGIDGVVGAQLAGAGLGGCMMVLVRNEAVARVEQTLKDRYYRPHQEQPRILECRPIAGSGVLFQKAE